MDLSNLQIAALKRFAEQGFNGTLLSQIAADVGIKPPSIYAHFKGKEDLFLSLIEPTIEEELNYVREALADCSGGEKILSAFLGNIERRFEKAPMMRFLLHMVYIPPLKLAGRIDKPVQQYMNKLDKIMLDAFKRLRPGSLTPEILADAYMGIIDSLQAEILYGGKRRFRRRLKALWAVFRLAL